MDAIASVNGYLPQQDRIVLNDLLQDVVDSSSETLEEYENLPAVDSGYASEASDNSQSDVFPSKRQDGMYLLLAS